MAWTGTKGVAGAVGGGLLSGAKTVGLGLAGAAGALPLLAGAGIIGAGAKAGWKKADQLAASASNMLPKVSKESTEPEMQEAETTIVEKLLEETSAIYESLKTSEIPASESREIALDKQTRNKELIAAIGSLNIGKGEDKEKKKGSWIGKLMKFISSIFTKGFWSKLFGGSVLIMGLISFLTAIGAFLFSPLGLGILAAAVIILNWKKVKATIKAAIKKMMGWYQAIKDTVSGVWDWAKSGFGLWEDDSVLDNLFDEDEDALPEQIEAQQERIEEGTAHPSEVVPMDEEGLPIYHDFGQEDEDPVGAANFETVSDATNVKYALADQGEGGVSMGGIPLLNDVSKEPTATVDLSNIDPQFDGTLKKQDDVGKYSAGNAGELKRGKEWAAYKEKHNLTNDDDFSQWRREQKRMAKPKDKPLKFMGGKSEGGHVPKDAWAIAGEDGLESFKGKLLSGVTAVFGPGSVEKEDPKQAFGNIFKSIFGSASTAPAPANEGRASDYNQPSSGGSAAKSLASPSKMTNNSARGVAAAGGAGGIQAKPSVAKTPIGGDSSMHGVSAAGGAGAQVASMGKGVDIGEIFPTEDKQLQTFRKKPPVTMVEESNVDNSLSHKSSTKKSSIASNVVGFSVIDKYTEAPIMSSWLA